MTHGAMVFHVWVEWCRCRYRKLPIRPSLVLFHTLSCINLPERFQEKRGHRESRLLENIDKLVVETNDQMLPSYAEDINEQMSNIIARCKRPLSVVSCDEIMLFHA